MAKTYCVKWKWSLARLTWIYTFFAARDSAEAAVERASEFAIVNAFQACHSSSVALFQVSASRVPIVGDDAFVKETARKNPGYIEPSSEARIPDVTNVTARLELQGGGHNRVLSLRGLVDSRTVRATSGADQPTQNFTEAMIALREQLIRDGYQLRFEVPTTTVGYGWQYITSIAPQVDTNFQNSIVTTSLPHGFNVGDTVKFSTSDDLSLLSYQNTHRVLAKTDTTFTIRARYWSPQDSILPVNFRVRKLAYSTATITGGEFQDFSTRNTGNSAGRKRGAARKRSYRK